MAGRHFTAETFAFLSGLAANNERSWFEAHRHEYEAAVRGPALDFIADMGRELERFAPHFVALPRGVGGSLMRIHRDVRFSRDKSPYKTNIGIQFRHELGRDVHAPGYYVHVEPGGCFLGVGLWRPDAGALGRIREYMAAQGGAWLKARDDTGFRESFDLDGERLANVPRGFSRDHPLADDLKWKDFVGFSPLSDADVLSRAFLRRVAERFDRATPYMRFLCRALDLAF